jgi:hypothetical protein
MTSNTVYRWFDLLTELDEHVKEVSGKGWELVSTESIGHGAQSGYVLFWKNSTST